MDFYFYKVFNLILQSAKRLFIPINHTFHYTQFQEALTYQKTNPSRGRNLISFEN